MKLKWLLLPLFVTLSLPALGNAAEILPGSSMRMAGGYELQVDGYNLRTGPRCEIGWAHFTQLEKLGISIDVVTSFAWLENKGEFEFAQPGLELGVSFEFRSRSFYLYPRLLGGIDFWIGDGGGAYLPLIGAGFGSRYQIHERFGVFLEAGYKLLIFAGLPANAFMVSAGILAF